MLAADPLMLTYAANVLVAGFAGAVAFFGSQSLVGSVFGKGFFGGSVRVTGALWLAIAACSLAGMYNPEGFAAVLAIQLVYKGAWLFACGFPAMLSGNRENAGMFWFFCLWVTIVPWIIPWQPLVLPFIAN
jgi:hypothetical protein